MEAFWTSVQPALFNLLAVTAVGVLGAFAVILPKAILAAQTSFVKYLERKTGIEIEQKMQDDLHRAATTGALAAIEKVRQGVLSATDTASLVKVVVDHVRESVPDAINGLKPVQDVLVNIAVSKLTAELAKITSAKN